jgi:hypothetical protein
MADEAGDRAPVAGDANAMALAYEPTVGVVVLDRLQQCLRLGGRQHLAVL